MNILQAQQVFKLSFYLTSLRHSVLTRGSKLKRWWVWEKILNTWLITFLLGVILLIQRKELCGYNKFPRSPKETEYAHYVL